MTPQAPPKDTLQDWIKAIAIWSFLLFWGFFMFVSFTNGACRDFDRPAEKRLKICERGDRLGSFLLTDVHESGMLRARAIALAELGRDDEAVELFRRSMRLLPSGLETWSGSQREAIRSMAEPDVPDAAKLLWRAILTNW